MNFYKSMSSYEDVLADVEERGDEVIKVVTDIEGEHHILTKDKNGRRHRLYFVGPATIAEEADMTKQAADVTSEALEMVVKAVQARHYCSARDARVAVNMALQQGTFNKLATRHAMLANLGAQHSSARSGASGFMAKVANIRTANPKMNGQDAMRQAQREHPDAFAAYQAG